MARKQDIKLNKHTLTRNFNEAIDMGDLKFMLGEFTSQLEDIFNGKVDIYLTNSGLTNPKLKLPTLKKGDIVFDFVTPNSVIFKQWDGEKLVTLNLTGTSGTVDLILQGIGSGTNPNLFLRSDGSGGWTLSLVPLYSIAWGLTDNRIPVYNAFFNTLFNSQIFDDGTTIIAGYDYPNNQIRLYNDPFGIPSPSQDYQCTTTIQWGDIDAGIAGKSMSFSASTGDFRVCKVVLNGQDDTYTGLNVFWNNVGNFKANTVGFQANAPYYTHLNTGPGAGYTADRTLTVKLQDANRVLILGGDLTTSGNVTLIEPDLTARLNLAVLQ